MSVSTLGPGRNELINQGDFHAEGDFHADGDFHAEGESILLLSGVMPNLEK